MDWLFTSIVAPKFTGAASGKGGGLLLSFRVGGGTGAASSGGATCGGGGAGAFGLVRFLILGAGTGGESATTQIRRVLITASGGAILITGGVFCHRALIDAC